MSAISALILQLTDCHLQEADDDRLLGVDTTATFDAVLEQALREDTPDLLLLTGDLAHTPTVVTYRKLRALVQARFSGPVAVIPGNHDALAPMAEVFPELAVERSLPPAATAGCRTLAVNGLTLALCDSHVDDQPESVIAADTEAALLALARDLRGPLLLVLHHPLRPCGTPWLDKDCVPGGERLLERLAQLCELQAVVFGHVHQPVTDEAFGVPLLGTPSTCFQFAPGSPRFSITTEQPGYRWLRFAPASGISTTLRRLNAPVIRVDAQFVASGS